MPNPLNWMIRDNPGAADFFGNMGLGLAAMSQGGQPVGTSRFAQAAPFFQSAMQAPQQARQQAMMAELMQYKMEEAKRQQREAKLAQISGERLQRTMAPWSDPDTGTVTPEGMSTFRAGPGGGLPEDARGALMALPPSQAPGALLKYMAGTQNSGQETFGNNPIWGKDEAGNPVLVQTSNRGNASRVPIPQGVTLERPGARTVDAGNEILIFDASGGLVGRKPKGLQPGEEPKVRYEQAFETALGKAAAEMQTDPQKKALNAIKTLENLDGIEALIDKSTGSMGGAALDALSSVFGHATEGSIASGKLKVLQAGLVLNMPRLEGPQSDKDRALYIEAAGSIGDPTVPGSVKKGAVETIREIQNRYTKAAPKSSGVDYKSKYGLE